ncbi:ribonuclease R [Thioclava dalianensis]|uniref:Ribonuclease R n=1 Tax=Thioclava dalianensis TaxID=1185766 RepID=A0A074TBU2_9RHOB|nr:ribonuclease R [Thioclava dalianensis]KEP69184.1 ribonuclease R [Thioclava dalianensis]SFM91658.1 ribonuclease R [Thioclava dalianensis]
MNNASQTPSRQQILDWLNDNPGHSAKRDIARAFGVKGPAKIELKRILREMQAEGLIEKRARKFHDPNSLPPVTVLRMLREDASGDQWAEPAEWEGEGAAPSVLFIPKKGEPALAEGDRILGRLTPVEDESYAYQARMIRKIGEAAHRVVGIFRKSAEGGRIMPIDKGISNEWQVPAAATLDAKDGELVEAEQTGPRGRMGLPKARVIEVLGDPSAPRAVSLIAIHQHGIPDDFPDAVVAEADAARPAKLEGREDLTDLNFVTIDPADARDRDDAVLVLPDDDPKNAGGHHLWVAIADVAHYVTPGSELDREARKRGNSSYFPDRVVPMLPDSLSGDLCSLHENVDRAVLAVKMTIDAQGRKIAHRFTRGMIRSIASLEYGQVQDAQDGNPDEKTEDLVEPVIAPIYACYQSLLKARAQRQPLELDLPERQIVLGDDGKVASIRFKQRLDAHKLIEEFMVLANVAAAEELERLKRPLLYRVHEEPSLDKIEALREVAQASGFTLAKGQVLKTAHLNNLLAQSEGSEFDELLNITTLRSMTQAYYHPQNYGHFGLALRSYAHFTSPIRRYSDLIVHRALIAGHRWGKDGLSEWDIENLEDTAKQISDTERRSMVAERDTTDRYLAAYLSDRVGSEFTGRIAGVQKFGAFVKLDETGADGLIPIREIGREFFHYDREAQELVGAESGLTIAPGLRVTVRLAEAVPVTGGLVLELLDVDGKAMPKGRRHKGKRPGTRPPRKPARGAAKKKAIARKVKRTRKP